MVTKCVEAGRLKCDQYWPSDMEPVFYGDLQVTVVNEDSSCQTWTIRELQITMVCVNYHTHSVALTEQETICDGRLIALIVVCVCFDNSKLCASTFTKLGL